MGEESPNSYISWPVKLPIFRQELVNFIYHLMSIKNGILIDTHTDLI